MKKETFNKKTKAQQRVIIAKDVLLRINDDKIIPTQGRFCKLPAKIAEDNSASLQDFMNKNKKHCYACGKGSLFMSFVGIKNEFTRGDIYGGENINSSAMIALSKIFTPQQLALIETAFEKVYYYWNVGLTVTQKTKAIEFGKKFKYPSGRLIAIMKNIIKNKGTFTI